MARTDSNTKRAKSNQSFEMEVILRLKPLPGSGQSVIVGAGPRNITIARPISNDHISSDVHEYQFDWILPETSSQTDTFKKSCPNLLNNLFSGSNSTLFCYGQSGSGKTFTISGDKKTPGILQSILCSVFRSINKNSFITNDKNLPYSITIPTKKNIRYTVFISYLECFNNKLYDLLELESSSDPSIVNMDNDVIRQQSEKEVRDIYEAYRYLNLGMKKRKVYDTQANRDSNRSHAIFTIKLIQTPKEITEEELSKNPSLSVVSTFRIVDLAGFDNKFDLKGQRIKDTANIQSSLEVLSKCFDALKERASIEKIKSILNESELTRMCKEYFLGNSKAIMIVNISSNSIDFEQTLKALSFSHKVKQISSPPKQDSDINEHDLDDLQIIGIDENHNNVKEEKCSNCIQKNELKESIKEDNIKPNRPSLLNSSDLKRNDLSVTSPLSNRHLEKTIFLSPSSDSNLLSPPRPRRTPSRLQYDVMDIELSVRSEVADEMSNSIFELESFYKTKYEQYYDALIRSIMSRMDQKIEDLIEEIQNKDIENESLLRTIKKKDSIIENLRNDLLLKDKLLEEQKRSLYFEIEEKDLSVQDIKVKYRQELEILKEELEKLTKDYKRKLKKSKDEIDALRKKLKEKEKKKAKKEALKKEEKVSKKKKSKKRSSSDIYNNEDKENSNINLPTPKKQKKIPKKPNDHEECRKKTVVFTEKEYKTKDGQIIRTPLRRRLRSHRYDY